MLIALWLLKKINAKGYRWLGPYADDGITPLVDSDSIYLSPPTTHNHCQSSSFLGKLWRSYSPFALSKQEWEYFSVPRRLGGMVIFQLLTQVGEGADVEYFFHVIVVFQQSYILTAVVCRFLFSIVGNRFKFIFY